MRNAVLQFKEQPMILRINSFLASPYYIVLVVLATLLCNLFGLELVFYSAFVLIVGYICFLGKDLLPLIPLVICAYLAPSVNSNPAKNPHSVFRGDHGGLFILALAAVLSLILIVYCISNAKTFFAGKRRMLPGMLAVCAAYLLGGIFSPAYPDLALKNLLFAAMQGAALLIPYCLIAGGIRWDEARKDYFAWTGFCAGGLLLCELCWIYLTGGVVENGVIDRNAIFTGWGQHNNIGGMLCMMMPFAFYLALRYRRGWIGTVAGSVFLFGIFMTCSRSSILVGSGVYLICLFMMLRAIDDRKGIVIILSVLLAGVVLAVVLFHEQLGKLFWELISVITDPSYRDVTWTAGWKQFVKYPIFGGSFYPIDFSPWDFSTVKAFSDFYPPRWHNTLVQLMACTGSVGLLAYGFHRLQTVKLLLREISREKIFIGCSLLALVGTSLFDCHFYNIGPVLFYSMGLAFAEKCQDGIEI